MLQFIEQTAIILLSNIRWLVSVTDNIGLPRGVRWIFLINLGNIIPLH
jgi:hypothetical protein